MRIVFLILFAITIISCKSKPPEYITEYVYIEEEVDWTKFEKIDLTFEDIVNFTAANRNIIVESSKDGKKTPARSLQYFVSETVVYGCWVQNNPVLTISKKGYLKKTDMYQDREFIIYNSTPGILDEEPEMQDGRYVLKVNFGNIVVDFIEDNDGFFSPVKYITYGGFQYSTQSTKCRLQYAQEVDESFTKNSASANGMRVTN